MEFTSVRLDRPKLTRVALLTVVGVLIVLFGASPAALALSEAGVTFRGAVEMVLLPNGNLQLALDEFDESGSSDGIADHLFILQEVQSAKLSELSAADASVSFTPGKLMLRFSPRHLLFWRLVPDTQETEALQQHGAEVLFGVGISHHHGHLDAPAAELAGVDFYSRGDTPLIIPDGGGGVYCQSGGIGATECSQTCFGAGSGSCSAKCSVSNYACCNCDHGNASCRCHRLPPGYVP